MPQFQELQPNPGFGSRLGAALGGGVTQGINDYLKQLPERQALERYNQSLNPGKFPPAAIDNLNPGQPEVVQPVAQSQQRQTSDSKSAANFLPQQQSSQYKVQPVLASKQVPPPTRSKDILAHSQAVQTARARGDKLTEKGRESRRSKAEEAANNKPLIARSEQLAATGNVSGVKGFLQAKLGENYPSLKGADVKEFQRLTKEQVVGRFRQDFGARPAASEFFYIQDVYQRAGDPKESIIRNLRLEKEMNKLAEKRFELENTILSDYGEYPINLDAMIEERMTPYYQNMLKKLGYDDWAKKHKKETEELNKGEKKLKVYDSQGKHIGSINSDQIGELPEGYSAK